MKRERQLVDRTLLQIRELEFVNAILQMHLRIGWTKVKPFETRGR